MIPARGCVKNYHWGKSSEDSHIAHFNYAASKTPTKECSKEVSLERNNNNNSANDSNKNVPLAELWFGSHPSGPSILILGDHMVKLDEFLAKEPDMVGVIDHYYKYNKQLPFLFKILSIAQPLSLQAHPDKKLAKVLHQRDPKNYPDSNHKPELAIALTDFHVLCDFRPHSEIVRFFEELPPLRKLIGERACDHYKSSIQLSASSQDNDQLRGALGECFKRVMAIGKDAIINETKSLLSQYPNVMGKDLTNVVAELDNLYPGDPGIVAPFFLNYIKLRPGQAIYIRANKLHAYLRGECIECMACSDNVVRAGLTTKYRDVQTLTDMLDYEPVKTPQDLILSPKIRQQDHCAITLFAPTDEFQVEKIVISNEQDCVLSPVKSSSFIIVLDGKATTKDFFDIKTRHKLSLGFAGFVPPKIQLKLADIKGTLVMYRAFC